MVSKGHQCLSAVSPLGTTLDLIGDAWEAIKSPMPFGSQSAGDTWNLTCKPPRHLRSPMPCGSQSAGDQLVRDYKIRVETPVTNAFRQSVRWGREFLVVG